MLKRFFKKNVDKQSIDKVNNSDKSNKANKFNRIPCYINEDYVWSGRDYSTFADKAYVRNVIASRAINLVAVAASSIPINLYKFTGKENRFRLKSRPLTSLLNRPNCNMSRVAFIKSLIIYKRIRL